MGHANVSTIGSYQTIRHMVQAVKLSTENVQQVADWCGGRVVQDGTRGQIDACISVPAGTHDRYIRSGHWLVLQEDGNYCIYSHREFKKTFEPVKD